MNGPELRDAMFTTSAGLRVLLAFCVAVIALTVVRKAHTVEAALLTVAALLWSLQVIATGLLVTATRRGWIDMPAAERSALGLSIAVIPADLVIGGLVIASLTLLARARATGRAGVRP